MRLCLWQCWEEATLKAGWKGSCCKGCPGVALHKQGALLEVRVPWQRLLMASADGNGGAVGTGRKAVAGALPGP